MSQKNSSKNKPKNSSKNKPKNKPQNTNLKNTKPQNTNPKNTNPQNTKPQNTKSQNTKPQNIKSQNTKPKNTKSQNTNPKNTKPQNTKPQNTKSQNTTSKSKNTISKSKNTISKHKTMSQKLFWYRGQQCKNFGDHIGPYLYQQITQQKPKFVDPLKHPQIIYLTVGSIMYWSNRNTIIWGSGIISKKERLKQPQQVIATRGPLTYQILKKKFPKLKLPDPPVYGDPALLLPRFYTPNIQSNIPQPNPQPKKYQIGIVPHKVDYPRVHKLLQKLPQEEQDQIKLIKLNITYHEKQIHQIIDEINQCYHIISSSLHGIIVAHAYQIPATWIKFSNKLHGDDIKFHDYFQSLPNFPEAKTIQTIKLNNLPDLETLHQLTQSTPQPKFPINTDPLWDSCPFRNNEVIEPNKIKLTQEETANKPLMILK